MNAGPVSPIEIADLARLAAADLVDRDRRDEADAVLAATEWTVRPFGWEVRPTLVIELAPPRADLDRIAIEEAVRQLVDVDVAVCRAR